MCPLAETNSTPPPTNPNSSGENARDIKRFIKYRNNFGPTFMAVYLWRARSITIWARTGFPGPELITPPPPTIDSPVDRDSFVVILPSVSLDGVEIIIRFRIDTPTPSLPSSPFAPAGGALSKLFTRSAPNRRATPAYIPSQRRLRERVFISSATYDRV